MPRGIIYICRRLSRRHRAPYPLAGQPARSLIHSFSPPLAAQPRPHRPPTRRRSSPPAPPAPLPFPRPSPPPPRPSPPPPRGVAVHPTPPRPHNASVQPPRADPVSRRRRPQGSQPLARPPGARGLPRRARVGAASAGPARFLPRQGAPPSTAGRRRAPPSPSEHPLPQIVVAIACVHGGWMNR